MTSNGPQDGTPIQTVRDFDRDVAQTVDQIDASLPLAERVSRIAQIAGIQERTGTGPWAPKPDTTTEPGPDSGYIPDYVLQAQERAIAMRAQNRALGSVASQSQIEEGETQPTSEDVRRSIASARLAQMRAGERVPEVRESVQSDLGGGDYTHQERGTVNPDRLAPVTRKLGYGWNPNTRRVEYGLDVIQGKRHIFLPKSENYGDAGMEAADAEAEATLLRGGGTPVRKPKRKK